MLAMITTTEVSTVRGEPRNGAPAVSLQEFVCAAPNVAFCAEADDAGGNAGLRSRP